MNTGIGIGNIKPIPESEYLERQRRLGLEMETRNLDAVFMLGYNARYISGYNPLLEDVAYIQLASGDKILLPGPECITLAQIEAKGIDRENIIITSDTMISGEGYPYVLNKMKPLSEIISRYRHLKWGVAGAGSLPKGLADSLEKTFGGYTDVSDILQNMRMIKSSNETGIMRACYIAASNAVEEGLKHSNPGVPGFEIAGKITETLLNSGMQQVSEIIMVESGPETEPCINRPSGRKIQDGELVLLDAGAILYGYYSDMGRTFLSGERKDPKAEEALKIVYEAQEAAFQKMGPGIPGKDVDRAARSIIEKYYPDNMTYQIAHSVGIEHCESPHCQPVGPFVNLVLKPGMVFALDCGIWGIPLGEVDGIDSYTGGIRIEDGVLITENGAERLNNKISCDPDIPLKHGNYR